MGASSGDKGSRPRKAYCITKAREPWSPEEHARFLEALEKYGRNWKEIVNHVGSRSVQQIRSHAQKFFLKLEKEGQKQVIPPPRPKKRPARPYPHKQSEAPPPVAVSRSRRSTRQAGSDSSTVKRDSSDPSDAGTFRRQVKEDPDADEELAAELGLLPAADPQSTASAMTTRSSLRSKSLESEADEQSVAGDGAQPAAPVQNWAELYAILGSLFDNDMSVTDHLAMLQHLPEKQRMDLLPMLNNLKANLQLTVQQQKAASLASGSYGPVHSGSRPLRSSAAMQAPPMVPVSMTQVPTPYSFAA